MKTRLDANKEKEIELQTPGVSKYKGKFLVVRRGYSQWSYCNSSQKLLSIQNDKKYQCHPDLLLQVEGDERKTLKGEFSAKGYRGEDC